MAGVNRWASWLQVNGPGRFQLSSKVGWDAFVNTAAREPLQQLTRREMTELAVEELEDYTEARMVWNANAPTVKTHQLTAAFEVIDQVMASNRRDADRLRGSVVIDAAPGLARPPSPPATPATSTAAPTAAKDTKPPPGINGFPSRSSPCRPGSR